MKNNFIRTSTSLTTLVLFSLLIPSCGDNSSSNSPQELSSYFDPPSYTTEENLPDRCEMDLAKVGDVFFVCFENSWKEVTDSDIIKLLTNNPNENEIKDILEELKQRDEAIESSSSSSYVNVSYGCMTDPRDQQKYKTVKIGSQVWMAENLNYYDENNLSLRGATWCYDNDEANCAQMGRLYTWSAAVDRFSLWDKGKGIACGYYSQDLDCEYLRSIQGICPQGWRLPDEADWAELFMNVGGKRNTPKLLKSQTGWDEGSNGIDTYGFGALPAGYVDTYNQFSGAKNVTHFWTPGATYSHDANVFTLDDKNDDWHLFDDDSVLSLYSMDKNYGLSVRCIKDTLGGEEIDSCSSKDNKKNLLSSSSNSTESSNSNINCISTTNWNWTTPKECYLNPDIRYDEFTDSRDGKKYKTVTIGSQIWMAENLNYYDSNLKNQSWCYNELNTSCEKAGRLYTWAAAIGKTEAECGYGNDCNLKSGNVQGICPIGWHLPTFEEWNAMIGENVIGGEEYAGQYLISKFGWGDYHGGDYHDEYDFDFYGFAAMPTGWRGEEQEGDSFFIRAGDEAHFWSATEYGDEEAYGLELSGQRWISSYSSYKNQGFSVRCVKDSE